MLNRKIAVAGAIGAVSIAAVVGVSLTGANASSVGVSSDTFSPVAAVPADLKAFPVFRRTQGAKPDSDIVRTLAGSSRSGQNVALARSVAGPDGPVWIAPGNGSVCVDMPDPVDGYGVACSDTATALKQGAVGYMVDPSKPRIAKVTIALPDKAKATVTKSDGAVVALDAVDGVVSTSIEDGKTLNVTAPDGTVTSLPMPGALPVHPTAEEKALAAAQTK